MGQIIHKERYLERERSIDKKNAHREIKNTYLYRQDDVGNNILFIVARERMDDELEVFTFLQFERGEHISLFITFTLSVSVCPSTCHKCLFALFSLSLLSQLSSFVVS